MATYEQVGRTLVEDKSGKKTLTVTYLGDAIASAASISGGSIYTKTVVSSESGTIKTIYQYDLTTAGSVTTAGGNIVGIEFVGSLRTVPIEAHPNFAEPTLYPDDIKAVKDAVLKTDFTPDFNGTTTPTAASALYEYLITGVQSFYEPSIILRKTYFSSSLPGNLRLGRIEDPGINYYAAGPDQDWLLVSANARGNASNGYTIVLEFELSGEKGWDPDLYG